MKKIFINSAIILTSFISFSQDNNAIGLFYGTANSEFLRNDRLVGNGSYNFENFNKLGIRYLRKINSNFSIETGVNYTKADLKINPAFTGIPVSLIEEDFALISIPVYANYTLWNLLFINGGPIVDFQNSENLTDSQSGIGYGVGLGAKYNFKNISIFLNPNFQRHAVIPFKKENHHQKLTEFGIHFGLGYRF